MSKIMQWQRCYQRKEHFFKHIKPAQGKGQVKINLCVEKISNVMYPGWYVPWMVGGLGGKRIHAYVGMHPFSVHLKLSQHCLLIVYTPIQNKKFLKIPS